MGTLVDARGPDHCTIESTRPTKLLLASFLDDWDECAGELSSEKPPPVAVSTKSCDMNDESGLGGTRAVNLGRPHTTASTPLGWQSTWTIQSLRLRRLRVMGFFPSEEPDLCPPKKTPAHEQVLIREVSGQHRSETSSDSARLVDASAQAAHLRCPADDAGFAVGRFVEIGVEATWSRARVVWTRVNLEGARYGGVIFTDPEPRVLAHLRSP